MRGDVFRGVAVGAVRSVVETFLPPICLLCHEGPVAERPEICRRCRSSFRLLREAGCVRCGGAAPAGAECCRLCRGWRHLAQARSALLFAGAMRSWVHALKFEGLTGLAALAADPLERCFRSAPAAWTRTTAIVPVPLHRTRLRERGFNAAELLARSLAARLDLPLLRLLERSRPTVPQAGLSGQRRRENVLDALRVPASVGVHCRGRAVLIVDDVLTTGSTLEAGARALRAGGAREVFALTLARAVPDFDAS